MSMYLCNLSICLTDNFSSFQTDDCIITSICLFACLFFCLSMSMYLCNLSIYLTDNFSSFQTDDCSRIVLGP